MNDEISKEQIIQAQDETFLAFIESLKLLSNKHLGSLIATATQILINNPADDSTPQGKPIFNSKGEFIYHAADAFGTTKVLTVRTIATDEGEYANGILNIEAEYAKRKGG